MKKSLAEIPVYTGVVEPSWPVYKKLELFESDAGLVMATKMSERDEPRTRLCASDLPTGFFRVELMDVDTSNPNSVLAFCRKWGALRSPLYRYGFGLPNGQLEMDEEGLGSIVEDAMDERVPSWKDDRPTHRIRTGELKLRNGAYPVSAVLFKEVVGTIDLLKWTVRKMLEEAWESQSFRDAKSGHFYSLRTGGLTLVDYAWRAVVNHHLMSSRVFEMEFENGGLPFEDDELLTSAICHQILDTWACEDEPWKLCPDCGKVFKFQHGSRRRGAKYCCAACGQNARQKKCRASKKIDHGL